MPGIDRGQQMYQQQRGDFKDRPINFVSDDVEKEELPPSVPDAIMEANDQKINNEKNSNVMLVLALTFFIITAVSLIVFAVWQTSHGNQPQKPDEPTNIEPTPATKITTKNPSIPVFPSDTSSVAPTTIDVTSPDANVKPITQAEIAAANDGALEKAGAVKQSDNTIVDPVTGTTIMIPNNGSSVIQTTNSTTTAGFNTTTPLAAIPISEFHQIINDSAQGTDPGRVTYEYTTSTGARGSITYALSNSPTNATNHVLNTMDATRAGGIPGIPQGAKITGIIAGDNHYSGLTDRKYLSSMDDFYNLKFITTTNDIDGTISINSNNTTINIVQDPSTGKSITLAEYEQNPNNWVKDNDGVYHLKPLSENAQLIIADKNGHKLFLTQGQNSAIHKTLITAVNNNFTKVLEPKIQTDIVQYFDNVKNYVSDATTFANQNAQNDVIVNNNDVNAKLAASQKQYTLAEDTFLNTLKNIKVNNQSLNIDPAKMEKYINAVEALNHNNASIHANTDVASNVNKVISTTSFSEQTLKTDLSNAKDALTTLSSISNSNNSFTTDDINKVNTSISTLRDISNDLDKFIKEHSPTINNPVPTIDLQNAIKLKANIDNVLNNNTTSVNMLNHNNAITNINSRFSSLGVTDTTAISTIKQAQDTFTKSVAPITDINYLRAASLYDKSAPNYADVIASQNNIQKTIDEYYTKLEKWYFDPSSLANLVNTTTATQSDKQNSNTTTTNSAMNNNVTQFSLGSVSNQVSAAVTR